jgi:hypothetical protein
MPMSNYAPFTSNPSFSQNPYQPFTGFEGMPGTGMGGMTDTVVQMLLQSYGGQMAAQRGMMPLGLSDANVYDRVERLRMQEMHDKFVARAFEEDVPGMMQTARGLAAVSGLPWDQQAIDGTRAWMSNLAAMGPALTQIAGPQLIDQLAGYRGSSGVMATTMFQGSRFRLDPVTGQAGMSLDSIQQMHSQVYSDLYGDGSFARNTGIAAGSSGALFSEMGRYGMLPGPVQMRDINQDVIRQAAISRGIISGDQRLNLSSLSSEQMSSLKEDPGVADAIRTFDAKRVGDTLEDYGRVVQAMREIFGDSGRPNAPIPELINALNAMTGGGMQQINPQEMAHSVRKTYNLAKTAGVSLDGMMALTQAAEAQTAQYGLPPVMANQLVQESLAYRAAYMHQGVGSQVSWGRGNIDQMMALNQQMAAGGQDSPLANRVGMALRMQDALSNAGTQFEEGSRAQAYSNAVRAGLTEYIDPTTGESRSIIMGESEFVSMMENGSGLSRPQIYDMLQDRFNNMREFRAANGTGTIRRAQNVELRKMLRDEVGGATTRTLRSAGLSGEDAKALSVAATGVAMSAFSDSSIYADDDRRSTVIAKNIRDKYKSMAGGGGPNAAAAQRMLDNYGENDPFWVGLAEQQYSQVQEVAENNPYVRTTAQNLLTLQDPTMSAQVEREHAREAAKAMYQDALAPANRGSGFLRRGITALQQADEGSDLTGVFLKAIGGEDQAELQRLLTGSNAARGQTTGVMQDVASAGAAFRQAQDAYEKAMESGDPGARSAAAKTLEARRSEFKAANQRLVEMIGDKGFYLNDTIDRDDVINMQRSRKWVTEQIESGKTKGDLFREGVENERQNASDLIAKVSSDKELMTRLGSEGRRQLQGMETSARKLDQMAVAYAGGSLSDLMAGRLTGEYSEKERRRIMGQVGMYRNAQGSAYSWFQSRVDGNVGYSFLSKEEQERMKGLASVMASDPRLKDFMVGSDTKLMNMSEDQFKALKSSAAWGEMTTSDRNLIEHARQGYRDEQKAADEYSAALKDRGSEVLERSVEKLVGRDVDRDELAKIVGGEQALQEMESDNTTAGRRRRAGFALIARDISRQRELESKKRLSRGEKAELDSIKKRSSGYDSYFHQLGGDVDENDALAPGAGDFGSAYGKIPSQRTPKGEGEKKDMEATFTFQEVYLNGENVGAMEGNARGQFQANRDM